MADRLFRIAICALLVTACAGPVPSGLPETSLIAEGSPSPVPSPSDFLTTPTDEPTNSLEPRSEWTLPPRTNVEINTTVVDRPGVPEALRDHYWWTDSDAGRLGTTAQIGIPSDELILDVSHDLVVSVLWYPSRGRHVIVRDFDSGQVIREFDSEFLVQDVVVVGRSVVWTGMTSHGSCPDDYVDGGVWSLDVDTNHDARAIVAPGQPVECGFTGRRLLLSPSRQTIGGVMGSPTKSNWVDVIDVDTLKRRDRVRDAWPWAITDDAYLQWDNKPSDFMTQGWGMSAYDLSSGDILWRFPDRDDVDKFAPYPIMAIGKEFVVDYSWARPPSDNIHVIAAFDATTGQRRELLRQEGLEDLLRARLELSAETHLVLDSAREDWPVGTFSTLEIATGALVRDAFTIDPPWLCVEEACFRDD
jgi:hypothetical protein